MRSCSICAHPQAPNIDIALLAGDGFRGVAQRYGVDKSTVSRHLRLHLKPRLTAAETAAPARVQAMESHEAHLDVMRAMRELHSRTLALLERAEAAGDLPTALRAIREARGNLELIGRLDGSLDGPTAASHGPVSIVVQYVDRQLVVAGTPQLGDGEAD